MLDKRQNLASQRPVEMIPGCQDFVQNWVRHCVVEQQEFWHITQCESVPDILRDGLLPLLGPRSQDAGETKPGIFLFPSYETAEDALLNWLGEQFPEDTGLALLKIRLPHDVVVQLESDADYELVYRQAIPASCIVGVFDEGGLPCQR